MALIDLPYSEELDQFFHGFEFALLIMPPELNYVKLYLMEPDKDKPFSDRLESFGFESSYFLV